jgi:hypothetical protein
LIKQLTFKIETGSIQFNIYWVLISEDIGAGEDTWPPETKNLIEKPREGPKRQDS